MSVAELVRKYQDFLPAQGMQELAQTALAPRPVMSESEQEYPPQATLRPTAVRNKSRHRVPTRKASTSDFEQGYAANVAPKYLTHRRPLTGASSSRIPAPKGPIIESQDSSRRPSPEKRPSGPQGREQRPSRPPSPGKVSGLSNVKQTKNRVVSRSKDKSVARPPTAPAGRGTFRRPPPTPGSKVSNIAKHFERLGREAERSKTRYAVIRGKRARPVASARARVEVLESVKDAIRDDSESSDSSSEADDEDEGNDEERPIIPPKELKAEENNTVEVVPVVPPVPEPKSSPLVKAEGEALTLPPQPLPGQISMPSSPSLTALKTKQDSTLTPPPDLELGVPGAERHSILKALSGFWPQPNRHSFETDDPMNDPEHIFRDSSMVVRLDEPTSIIALALK